jgi:hypothetical protein
MSKELSLLKNPKIKEVLLTKIDEEKDKAKNLAGAAATAINAASFGLPSKNSTVKNLLSYYRQAHPTKSVAANTLGTIGGALLPGGVALKGISLIRPTAAILRAKGIGGAAAQGALFSGSESLARNFAKGEKNKAVNITADTILGGMLGAGVGAGLKGMGVLSRKVKPPKSTLRLRKKIDQIGHDLYHAMSKRDLARLNQIVENEGSKSPINFNTLLHQGTPRQVAFADALYQRSGAARPFVLQRKKELIDNQLPYIEKIITNIGNQGKRPSLETLNKLTTEKFGQMAKPLYKQAYASGDITVPQLVKGSPEFKTALRKALASVNDVNKNKAEFGESSIRMLDKTKRHLDARIKKFIQAQDAESKMNAGEARSLLLSALDKASPSYQKARSTAEQYLKPRSAGEAAKDFKKMDLQKFKDAFQSGSPDVKEAMKTGVLEELLESAQVKGNSFSMPELSKDLTNPNLKPYFTQILGKQRSDMLTKAAAKNEAAIKNFRKFSEGSPTEEHASNKGILMAALSAARGSSRGALNLGYRLKDKLTGGEGEKIAKSQMKLLLNPKRLLAYKTKPIRVPRETSSKLASLATDKGE